MWAVSAAALSVLVWAQVQVLVLEAPKAGRQMAEG
jgi:hypothetical protein